MPLRCLYVERWVEGERRVKGLKDRDVPDSDVVLEILVAQGSLGKAF